MNYAVCAALVLAIGVASAIAHRQLPQASHLRMQWGFDGRPTPLPRRGGARRFTLCWRRGVGREGPTPDPRSQFRTPLAASCWKKKKSIRLSKYY